MRFSGRILVLLFLFMCATRIEAQQPKEMFKQKRERKRVWRRHRSSKDAYNPYLKKKQKDKPSERGVKATKKEERIAKRENRRTMRRSKRIIKKHSTVR
jgi:hypothetical protein